MRLSRYFLPILKENPREAEIVSHRLMLRAGMIRQQAQGSFTMLPLGKRVLDKVCNIIREEQNRAGALEILMPTIQSAELWRESGRYDDYGKEMLRIKDRQERDMLYGPTNEEVVTDIFRSYVKSYKDLPLNLYHIQWKYRDEVRPRFGVMRGREFLMKDAYSFDLNYEGARAAYNRMFVSYLRTFARMGLQAIPMRADTGPIGGDLSHEFIILADTGESQVFCHKDFLSLQVPGEDVNYDNDAEIGDIVQKWTTPYAATDEMHDEAAWGAIPGGDQVSARGIEVGHIFHFGEKYSKPLNAKVQGPDGKEHFVSMGSYGIGVSRMVAVIAEQQHDDLGLRWPSAVAPFDVHVVVANKDDAARTGATELVAALDRLGHEVLFDDRKASPGVKFKDAELLGMPWIVVVGRGFSEGVVELRNRFTGENREIAVDDAATEISAALSEVR